MLSDIPLTLVTHLPSAFLIALVLHVLLRRQRQQITTALFRAFYEVSLRDGEHEDVRQATQGGQTPRQTFRDGAHNLRAAHIPQIAIGARLPPRRPREQSQPRRVSRWTTEEVAELLRDFMRLSQPQGPSSSITSPTLTPWSYRSTSSSSSSDSSPGPSPSFVSCMPLPRPSNSPNPPPTSPNATPNTPKARQAQSQPLNLRGGGGSSRKLKQVINEGVKTGRQYDHIRGLILAGSAQQRQLRQEGGYSQSQRQRRGQRRDQSQTPTQTSEQRATQPPRAGATSTEQTAVQRVRDQREQERKRERGRGRRQQQQEQQQEQEKQNFEHLWYELVQEFPWITLEQVRELRREVPENWWEDLDEHGHEDAE